MADTIDYQSPVFGLHADELLVFWRGMLRARATGARTLPERIDAWEAEAEHQWPQASEPTLADMIAEQLLGSTEAVQ
jgi:hypothetical protein